MNINDRITYSTRGYSKQKILKGFVETKLDWDRLRPLKQKCEECPAFDEFTGGCRVGFMPGCTKEVK